MACDGRGARRVLHDADRFRPLPAGQSRHSARQSRHGVPRQGRPDQRAQGFRRGDQPQSELRARLRQSRQPARWRSAISTAPSPISTRRSSSIRPMPRLFMTRGNAYDDKGDFDHAIADYNEAIRLSPNYALGLLQSRARVAPQGRSRPRDRRLRSGDQARSAKHVRHQQPRHRLVPERRFRPRHRRLQSGDPARSQSGGRLQQSRRCLARQGRLRPRHRRFRPRHQALAAVRARLRQSRPRCLPASTITTAPSPISTTAIELDPKNAQAYTNRGNAYADKGDRDAALADYDAAVRLDPNNAGSHYDRGIALRRSGDLDRAIADLERGQSGSIRSSPAPSTSAAMPIIRSTISIAPLPTTMRRSGSTRNSPSPTTIAAMPMTTRAIPTAPSPTTLRRCASTPNYAAAYYNRGIAWRHKGDPDRAIADYDQAIKLNPTAAAYNNRGSAWAAKGEFDRAMADLDQAIKLDPRLAGRLHQPRQRQARAARPRRGDRRLHAGHLAVAERGAGLLQPRLGALPRRRERRRAQRRQSRHRARRRFGERILDARPDPRKDGRYRRRDRRFPPGAQARSEIPAAGRRSATASKPARRKASSGTHAVEAERPRRAADRRRGAVHGEHGLHGDRDLAAGHRARARHQSAGLEARGHLLSALARHLHSGQRLDRRPLRRPQRVSHRHRRVHPRLDRLRRCRTRSKNSSWPASSRAWAAR